MKRRPSDRPHKLIDDYLALNAQKYPNELALVDGAKRLNWRQLDRQADTIAANLTRLIGSKPQQIVALLMPNSWQYVAVCLGVWRSGNVVLPIDVIYKTLEIDAVVKQVPPTLVIADQANLTRITSSQTTIVPFSKLQNKIAANKKARRARSSKEQIASLLFTSGTTGTPKVVPHSHAHHLWNVEVCSQVWGWEHADSLLLSVRLSHWLGLVMCLVGAVYHGSTLYIHDRFDAGEILKMLAEHKITLFTHGPLVFARLLEVKNASKYDLSHVKFFISGSGPLPPPIWQRFKEAFGHEILEVYGTSETGRIASNLPNERIPGSPGRILPGVAVKIDSGGEVLIKSPGVIAGYYQNPVATKEHLTKDGYWRTGDIGQFKNDRIVLRGRVQEKIRKRGYSVSPRDVEWALHKNPSVKEIYVMGLQQPGAADDELVYYVVTDSSEAEIMTFCKANLPSVWRPDKIIILDEIPRTRIGKPHMARLESLAIQGAAK